MKKYLILLFVLLISIINAGAQVKFTTEKVLDFEADHPAFLKVFAVCEDDESNLYVLNRSSSVVFKFSNAGKQLLSFGRKGQGPGDLNRPTSITFHSGKIFITDRTRNISIFDKDGTFKNKFKINSNNTLWGISSCSLFLCSKLIPDKNLKEMTIEYFFIDRSGNSVLKSYKSYLSISRFGNSVFPIQPDEFRPSVLFHAHDGLTALANAAQYEIELINQKGQKLRTISREIRLKLNDKEFPAIESMIKEESLNIKNLEKIMIDSIGEYRNPLKRLYLTSKYLIVLRSKSDLSIPDAPYPVDIYDLKGEFKGEFEIWAIPSLWSDRFIYLKELNDDGEIFMAKYKYKISFLSVIEMHSLMRP